MKRRRFVTALGGVAGAGGLVGGTSSFNFANVERTVSVATVSDATAYLTLEPLPHPGINGEETGRSYTLGDGTVAFSIPGDQPGENDHAEGVGKDSIYEFYDLLRIGNQGTQPVQIYSEYGGNALADLALVNSGGLLREDPPSIEVGGSVDVGLQIDSHGSQVDEFDEKLNIIAKAPSE